MSSCSGQGVCLEKACQPAVQVARVPMRRFILGILLLMAVPAYTVAQQRDRSGSSTGRTAVPREQGVQAAPTGQTDRRAEPRGRWRDEHPQATPAHALNPGFRNASLNPGFLSPLNPGFL